MSTRHKFSNYQKRCLRKFNFYLKCSGSDSSILIYFYFSSTIYFVAFCTPCSTCVVMAAQFCTSALYAGTKSLLECLYMPGMKHPKGPNVGLWVHGKNIRKEANSAVCSPVEPLQQLSRRILLVVGKSAKLTLLPWRSRYFLFHAVAIRWFPSWTPPSYLACSFSLQFVLHPSSPQCKVVCKEGEFVCALPVHRHVFPGPGGLSRDQPCCPAFFRKHSPLKCQCQQPAELPPTFLNQTDFWPIWLFQRFLWIFILKYQPTGTAKKRSFFFQHNHHSEKYQAKYQEVDAGFPLYPT